MLAMRRATHLALSNKVRLFSALHCNIKMTAIPRQNNLFFAPEAKPKFNLREKIPQTKDARQVLMENPDITFIGIFNHETKEITLMPAMKEKNLEFYYNEAGEITKAKRIGGGKELTEEELKFINDHQKLFLPRRGYTSNNVTFYPSHTLMLFRMGVTNIADENPFYGFSVKQKENGGVTVNGNSLSLNRNKPGTLANNMRHGVQDEIEKIIRSWFPSEIENDKKHTLIPN